MTLVPAKNQLGRKKSTSVVLILKKKKLIRFWRAKESNFKNEKKKRKEKRHKDYIAVSDHEEEQTPM